jgi:hypothetical protein
MNAIVRRCFLLGLMGVLTACGGGGSADSAPTPPPKPPVVQPPPPPPPQPIIPTLTARFDGSDLHATLPLLAAAANRDLQSDAVVYDRQHDQLLVATSLPSGTATLLAMSPATLQTTWSIDLPVAATAMAIADDGSTLYVGLSNGVVRQYELPSRSLLREFELTEGRGTKYFVSSIAVRPGSAGTVAISSAAKDARGYAVFHHLAVWQDGIKWPQTLAVGPSLNNDATQLIFSDANTLLSLDTYTTRGVVLRIPISGQSLTPEFPGILPFAAGNTLQLYNDRILLAGGAIVDPSPLRLVVRPYGNGGVFAALSEQGTLSEVSLARLSSAPYQTRILVSEYFSDRLNVKRQALFDVPSFTADGNYYPVLTRVIDAGKGRVVLQLGDTWEPAVKLVVLDIGAVAPVLAPVAVTQSTTVQDVDVLAVTLPISGLAYDRQRDRVVGIIGPDGGPIGNSLVVLRPADGTIEARYPLSSQPGSVTVSDSGSVAYVTLPEENGFQRVDIGTSGGLRWRVTGLPFPVRSLAIAPDDSDKVAIVQSSQVHFSVYRGGAQVSQTSDLYPNFVYMSDVTFNGAHQIVVLDNHTTNNRMYRYAFDGPMGVQTAAMPKPLWQMFGNASFRGDIMHDDYSYASLSTGLRIGWIMRPEGRVMEIPNLPSSNTTYVGISLWSSTQGFGVANNSGKKFEVDLLSAQPGAQGGTIDLIGSRRLQIIDDRWPLAPAIYLAYPITVATGQKSAVVARSIEGTANTTLYFIKGL